MRAELNESAIEVASTRFASRSEAVAWFKKYLGNEPELIVCFADVHALMAMAMEDADSFSEDLKMRVDSKRAGYGSSDQASFCSSFALELPLQFGTPKQCGADLRVLPKFKTFEAFDTSVYATSFRYRELDKIKTTADRLQAITQGRTDVEYVSGDMLKKSVNFVSEMFVWMTSTVCSREKQQPDVPQSEHWKFVSQVVRAIFRELHKVRARGRHLDSASQFWYCLKGIHLQEEIQRVGFDNHSIVNNVLNEMLKTEIVTRTVMNGELKKIRAELQQVMEKADTAASHAQKALSKLPSKK